MIVKRRKMLIMLVGFIIIGFLLWQWLWGPSEPKLSEGESSAAAISVQTVKAQIGDVQSWVFSEGTARSDRREYLTFENPGNITYVKPGLREGSRVKKGELLAHQDQRRTNADLQAAESSLEEAKTGVSVAEAEWEQAMTEEALADKTFQRYATLLNQESASQQEYDEAKANADKAKADIRRSKSRIASAQAEVNAAEAKLNQARVTLEETELRAQIDGMVAYLNIEEGYYFMPSLVRTDSEEAALNTVPIVLIDPSVFEISVDIPIYDRDRVQIGQAVGIHTAEAHTGLDRPDGKRTLLSRTGQNPPDTFTNGPSLLGEVYSVNPAVSPSGRSVQVTIHTKGQNLPLKDGMYITAWIATEHKKHVLTAPLEAFFYRDNQPYVFVVNQKSGNAELREVKLGLQGFDRQEIVDGVSTGELLVTEGRYQLSDGTSVKILDEKGNNETEELDNE